MTARLSEDPPASWVEVAVRVAPADVEAVADVLRELSPAGVAIEPAIRTLDHDNFQYELLDAPTTLRISLARPLSTSERRALRRRLTALPLTQPLAPIRYTEVSDEDWAEEWKRFFGVQHVGERIVVRPSWEPYEARSGEVVIELDPGTAFGTGQHETTRLCLAAMERYVRPRMAILDVGTGSGILAIAAALLGAENVRACDTDANAVAAAKANVARKGIASSVDCRTGSLGLNWPWDEPAAASADLVVANISSVALVELMPEIARALRPHGWFIGSGFIDAGLAKVEAAAQESHFETTEVMADGEWRCLIAGKPGSA
jgi:ribosomal protein L11 methyltransferase